MDTEQMVRYGSVCGLLMMIGLVVAIGIVAHSVWVGLMCFVGLVLLFVAWNKGTDFEYGPFFLWTLVGLALVGGATWLSRFAGRWLWVPLWLLVGFLLASAGWYIRKKDEEWVGVLALIVGVLCGLFALAGPLLLYGGPLTLPSLPAVSGWHFSEWWLLPAIAGFLSLLLGWKQGSDLEAGRYLIFSLVGLALLGVATWLSQFAYRWLWLAVWLLAAVLLGHGGKEVRWLNKAVGNLGLLLGALCALFALAGPLLLYGAPAPSAPQVEPGGLARGLRAVLAWLANLALGLGAVGPFLIAAVSSGWGLVYLVLLGIIGGLLIKKWGAPLFIGALLLAVLIWGGHDPVALSDMKHWVSSSPTNLMLAALTQAEEYLGSPGWGALLAGFVVALLLFPAYRDALRASRIVTSVAPLRSMLSTTAIMRYLRAKGFSMGRVFLAYLVLMGMLIAGPICMWIALRQMAGIGGPIPFPVLGLPDITVPHWRPVWNLWYFVLGALLGLSNVALMRFYRQRGLEAGFGCQSPVMALIGPLLLSLFAPAGVLLFLLGLSVGQGMTSPFVLRREKARKRPKPSPPRRPTPSGPRVSPSPRPPKPALPRRPRPSGPRVSPPPRPPKPTPSPKPVPAPALAGRLLFEATAPVVDLMAVRDDTYSVLSSSQDRQTVRLSRWKNGERESAVRLKIAEAIGLASPAEGDALVVGREGTVVVVSLGGDTTPSRAQKYETGREIACMSLNPYGTILTYGTPTEREVYALFLSGFKEQVLTRDLASSPAALAFSQDGRLLAIGCANGEVAILDMSTRQIVCKHMPTTFDPEGVVFVAPGPDRRWVAAYGSNYLICWNAEGEMEASKKLRSAVVSLTVDLASGRIAAGSRRGYVRVWPINLGEQVFAKRVHESKVVRMVFLRDGGLLVSAARGGTVREVKLR